MMDDLSQPLEQIVERDPDFAGEFEAATAELRLAMALADLRVARGWSQRHVAKRAGMTQATLARLERAGRTPTVVTLWRWARALDATIELFPDFSARVVDLGNRAEAANGASGNEPGLASRRIAR